MLCSEPNISSPLNTQAAQLWSNQEGLFVVTLDVFLYDYIYGMYWTIGVCMLEVWMVLLGVWITRLL
jgi:hypothetical protein